MNRNDFLNVEQKILDEAKEREESNIIYLEKIRLEAIVNIPQRITSCINEINEELKKVAELAKSYYSKENVDIFIEHFHPAQIDSVINAINEYLKTSGFKEYDVKYECRTININYEDCNDKSYEIRGLSIYINPWRK